MIRRIVSAEFLRPVGFDLRDPEYCEVCLTPWLCRDCENVARATQRGAELIECPVTPQDGELRRAVE